jgi:thiol-disulfide isomerase/thioredoxin
MHGKIVSGVILSIVVVLNSGCVGGLIGNKDTSPKPIVSTSQEPNILKKYKNPDTECKDNLTEKKSNCDRGTISEDELKSPPKDGSTHTLMSIRGKTINIIERPRGFIFPDYKDKVIILELFGKKCPHCLREIPVIDKIRRQYRGRLEVIAIQAQDRMTRSEAKAYINGNGIRYPIIEGEDAKNLQYFIQQTYGWTGILPYTLVIKDGITQLSYSGEVDYEEFKKDIDSLF